MGFQFVNYRLTQHLQQAKTCQVFILNNEHHYSVSYKPGRFLLDTDSAKRKNILLR